MPRPACLPSRLLGVSQAVHEQPDHASAEGGSCVGCWMAEECDGGQQVFGLDVGANLGMTHLDDLLAGMNVRLSDDILDRIDEIVPPGTDIGTLDQAYVPPAIELPDLRRRYVELRATA